MAKFSNKERFIAMMLSSTPGVKKMAKIIYSYLCYWLNKKAYPYKIHSKNVKGDIQTPIKANESFFGYYDKCPLNNNGWLLAHKTNFQTYKKPNPNAYVELVAVNIRTGEEISIAKSMSFSWQQGVRLQWLNEDLVIYNSFDGEKYISNVFSISKKKDIKTFNYPVQDSFSTDYFVSIDYRRLFNVAPDYGYRNLEAYSDVQMKDIDNNGIWKVDYTSGDSNLLLSMREILSCDYSSLFDKCIHTINHVMISPKGDNLMFIHRYYLGKVRYDRLMIYKNGSIKVLASESVSHCCWINNNKIFGYMSFNNKEGFYSVDISNGIYEACDVINALAYGDGHPTVAYPYIVVDTYPDKSRMQHLLRYNIETGELEELLEVFNSLKYMNETRCDLHPRYSMDGKYIFFDSVFSKRRTLCKIDL